MPFSLQNLLTPFKNLNKKTTEEELQKEISRKKLLAEAQRFAQGMVSLKDLLSPSGIEVDFNYLKIGNTFYRTFFV
ncbi:MAG: hypothetical protein UT63_C0082G0007, partial [Candidatus Gottesmanbacteria bacterium GW2011_GWC2_39_8]